MKIPETQLYEAARNGILSADQAEALHDFLRRQPGTGPGFTITNIPVFVVCGAPGCAGYLQHLASAVFADSRLFPVALTGIGRGIIHLGIAWQRNDTAISRVTRRMLPSAVQELLAARPARH